MKAECCGSFVWHRAVRRPCLPMLTRMCVCVFFPPLRGQPPCASWSRGWKHVLGDVHGHQSGQGEVRLHFYPNIISSICLSVALHRIVHLLPTRRPSSLSPLSPPQLAALRSDRDVSGRRCSHRNQLERLMCSVTGGLISKELDWSLAASE